ncbi:MAG TPA: hypothetical protein VF904_03675 [Anaeromyxobacteraceae bacterium]
MLVSDDFFLLFFLVVVVVELSSDELLWPGVADEPDVSLEPVLEPLMPEGEPLGDEVEPGLVVSLELPVPEVLGGVVAPELELPLGAPMPDEPPELPVGPADMMSMLFTVIVSPDPEKLART